MNISVAEVRRTHSSMLLLELETIWRAYAAGLVTLRAVCTFLRNWVGHACAQHHSKPHANEPQTYRLPLPKAMRARPNSGITVVVKKPA